MVRAAMGYRKKNPGRKNRTGEDLFQADTGSFWAVKVMAPGDYVFELRRWPTEVSKPLASSLPAGDAVPGASKAFRETPGEAISVVSAGLRLNGDVKATASVAKDSQSVQMSLSLRPRLVRTCTILSDRRWQRGRSLLLYRDRSEITSCR